MQQHPTWVLPSDGQYVQPETQVGDHAQLHSNKWEDCQLNLVEATNGKLGKGGLHKNECK